MMILFYCSKYDDTALNFYCIEHYKDFTDKNNLTVISNHIYKFKLFIRFNSISMPEGYLKQSRLCIYIYIYMGGFLRVLFVPVSVAPP